MAERRHHDARGLRQLGAQRDRLPYAGDRRHEAFDISPYANAEMHLLGHRDAGLRPQFAIALRLRG